MQFSEALLLALDMYFPSDMKEWFWTKLHSYRLLNGFAGNKFRHGYHQNMVEARGLLVSLFLSNQPEVFCKVKFTRKHEGFAVGLSGVWGYTKFVRCRQRLKRKRFVSRLWMQIFSIRNICGLAAVNCYWILVLFFNRNTRKLICMLLLD